MNRSRRFIPVVVLALAVTLLASCADDGPGAPSETPAGTFPVSIDHAQGTTTVESAPERVVALGAADVQIAQSLGAHIVGAAKNDYSADGQWLGVEPGLDAEVALLPALEPDLEKIAALTPDLILITSAQPGFSEAYDQLSKIAPVISYQKGILEDSGDDLVRVIGTALGVPERVEELIKESQRQLTEYAKAHPGLAESQMAFGQYAGGATYLVVSPSAPSTTHFKGLHVSLPERVAALPVQAPPGISVIPEEQLDILDTADAVILATGSDQDGHDYLERPVVSNLEITKDKGIHFIDFNEGSLLLTPNPASTKAWLELLDRVLQAS